MREMVGQPTLSRLGESGSWQGGIVGGLVYSTIWEAGKAGDRAIEGL